MAIYNRSSGPSGQWVDKKVLKNGQRAKIVSETKPIPGRFKDDEGNFKDQDVAKVRFEGQKESVNVNLNKPTIHALIEAFGEDSNGWQGHYLTVEVEKVRIGGKAVIALYLLPEGYEKADDDNGYAVVRKVGQTLAPGEEKGGQGTGLTEPVEYPKEEINPDDIPF